MGGFGDVGSSCTIHRGRTLLPQATWPHLVQATGPDGFRFIAIPLQSFSDVDSQHS